MRPSPARCVGWVVVLAAATACAAEQPSAIRGTPLAPAEIGPGWVDSMAAIVARSSAVADAAATGPASVHRLPDDDPAEAFGEFPHGRAALSPLVQSFPGAVQGDASQWGYPADASGAIGPNHFVEVANGHVEVFDRASGARLVNVSLTAFFSPLTTRGYPRVLYDQHSERWFVISSNLDSDARLQVAVSRSSDAGPSSQWFKFSFAADGGTDQGCWPDYPTAGVDGHGLYVAAYMAHCGMTVFAIAKTPLVAANPAVGAITAFRGLPFEGAIQPAHTHGDAPGEYLVSRAGATALRLRRIDPPITAPTLQTLPNVTIPTHAFPPEVAALGSTVPLDPLDYRLMNAVYVGGSLWTTHTIGEAGTARCRWYQIEPATGTLIQSGTIGDETLQCFYPSIAANARGDAAVGFSAAPPAGYVGAYLAARRATDPPGRLSAPVLLRDGAGPINFIDNAGRNRWGHYSQTALDPHDRLSLWTVQAYAHATNLWGTHIAAISYGDCNDNGLDDACDIDCARPGCAVGGCGSATDCNGNGVIDACEIDRFDCDANGVHDACDVAPGGAALDCNTNGRPDACDLLGADCNSNAVPDECDHAALRAAVSGPSETGACAGATATLSVTAPAGTSYQWYRDGVPLADTGRITGASTATLHIAGMSPEDEGAYACRVGAGCIAIDTSPAELHLLPARLTVVQQPVAQVTVCVAEGSGAAFEIRVDEPFGAVYQWYRDGIALVDDERIHGSAEARLLISPVTPSDAGRYACEVSNACGATAASAPDRGLLTVSGTRFELQPQSICADPGGPAVFRARVDSSPGTSLFWYREDELLADGLDPLGMQIEGARTIELRLDNVPSAYNGQRFKLLTLANAPVCLNESEPALLTVGGCGPCRVSGDLDADLDIDLLDLARFVLCFGAAQPSGSECACADLADSNGLIDLADWEALEPLLCGPR